MRLALLQFLLGNHVLSPAFLARLAVETNELRFFSTADLSTLLALVQRHSEKPLYRRNDRFGRRTASATTTRTITVSNAC